MSLKISDSRLQAHPPGAKELNLTFTDRFIETKAYSQAQGTKQDLAYILRQS